MKRRMFFAALFIILFSMSFVHAQTSTLGSVDPNSPEAQKILAEGGGSDLSSADAQAQALLQSAQQAATAAKSGNLAPALSTANQAVTLAEQQIAQLNKQITDMDAHYVKAIAYDKAEQNRCYTLYANDRDRLPSCVSNWKQYLLDDQTSQSDWNNVQKPKLRQQISNLEQQIANYKNLIRSVIPKSTGVGSTRLFARFTNLIPKYSIPGVSFGSASFNPLTGEPCPPGSVPGDVTCMGSFLISGPADKMPGPNPEINSHGNDVMPPSCKSDADCAKQGKTTCSIPTKPAPSSAVSTGVVGGGNAISGGELASRGVCSGSIKPASAKNPECDHDICIVTPHQDAVLSVANVNNFSTMIRILTGTQSRCRYVLNSDLGYASGETFMEDVAGVAFQHTIFMYYLATSGSTYTPLGAGEYSIYEYCRDESGKEVSDVQRFSVTESGISAKITGIAGLESTIKGTEDASGKINLNIPKDLGDASVSSGKKDATLEIEKDGKVISDIPITAEVSSAGSPAPLSNAGTIATVSIGSILLLAAISYLVRTAMKRAAKSVVQKSFMTVDEQNRLIAEKIAQSGA